MFFTPPNLSIFFFPRKLSSMKALFSAFFAFLCRDSRVWQAWRGKYPIFVFSIFPKKISCLL